MKPHQPTDASRKYVFRMSSFGISQEDIAKVIGIAPKTLREHYREELDTAETKANSMIAASLYKKAMGNGPQSVTAAIFWLKTRARWKDTTNLEVTGAGGGPVRTITDHMTPAQAAEAYAATLNDQRK